MHVFDSEDTFELDGVAKQGILDKDTRLNMLILSTERYFEHPFARIPPRAAAHLSRVKKSEVAAKWKKSAREEPSRRL